MHPPRPLVLAGFLLVTTVLPAQPRHNDEMPLLVDAQWLLRNAGDARLRVIAVGQTRAGYDSAHVRGAQFLPYRAYAVSRDGLTTELPPIAVLDSVLESIGVNSDSRIVIYGPHIISHRLFVTLEAAGMRGRAGMLDGGLPAWREAGGAVDSGPPATTARGRLALEPRTDVIVDRAWVRSRLGDESSQFVDGRMGRRFDEAHLPGALSVPAVVLLPNVRTGPWSFPPPDSLRNAFTSAGMKPGRELVAYCAIGETASVVYFTARYLGMPVRLYDGSLEEWQREPAGPLTRMRRPD